MANRVDELACFLARDGYQMDAHEIRAVIAERWPGMTIEEMQRAFDMAAEEKRENAAEDHAEAGALDTLAKAQSADGYDDDRR